MNNAFFICDCEWLIFSNGELLVPCSTSEFFCAEGSNHHFLNKMIIQMRLLPRAHQDHRFKLRVCKAREGLEIRCWSCSKGMLYLWMATEVSHHVLQWFLLEYIGSPNKLWQTHPFKMLHSKRIMLPRRWHSKKLMLQEILWRTDGSESFDFWKSACCSGTNKQPHRGLSSWPTVWVPQAIPVAWQRYGAAIPFCRCASHFRWVFFFLDPQQGRKGNLGPHFGSHPRLNKKRCCQTCILQVLCLLSLGNITLPKVARKRLFFSF